MRERSWSRRGRTGGSVIAAASAGAEPRVRSRRGAPALAGAGSRHDAGLRRGRRAAGDLSPRTASSSARSRGPVTARGSRARFEDQVAWLAVNTSKTAVAELMRIAWRTVGAICERVAAEAATRGRPARRPAADRDRRDLPPQGPALPDRRRRPRHRPAGLGGRRAATARPSRRSSTSSARSAASSSKLVSCDMAGWIAGPVAERCPNAERCVDPFHVVQLATDALDEIRREVWNEARRAGQTDAAARSQGRPLRAVEEPREPHRAASSQARRASRTTNRPLYRAYLLKEQLRQIYRLPADGGDRAARRVARVGTALPPGAVRQARPHDHRAARRHRRRDPSTASPTPASKRSTPRSG